MTGTWPTGWATGDVVTAAEYAKGVGCIYDTTLGVGAASIDVTGIVGSYAHLLVVAYMRSDLGGGVLFTDFQMRFNGDTGANYTTPGTTSATSVTYSQGCSMPCAATTSGVFGGVGALIPNYAATAADKVAVVFGTRSDNGSSSFLSSSVFGGAWRNTSAITRITISPAGGSFLIGTRMSIFALGA